MTGWTVPIDALVKGSKTKLETVVRRVTLEIFVNVVRRSPVDTGRFRANWNVSYGTPNVTTTEITQKGLSGRGTDEALRSATLPVGGVVYISNSLPYATRLENGWSQKAPYGMVKVSVTQFESAVKRALR